MIDGQHPPAALAQYSGFLLNLVAMRSGERFAAALSKLDLHPREFAALSIVAANPGRTQHEVSGAAAIDASTMVAMLDHLEERGLAERRLHPTDRRKRSIHLTPRGKRVLEQARTLAQGCSEELFAPLTPAERKRFEALLRKLAGVDGRADAATDSRS